jgi:hypothetical protein
MTAPKTKGPPHDRLLTHADIPPPKPSKPMLANTGYFEGLGTK